MQCQWLCCVLLGLGPEPHMSDDNRCTEEHSQYLILSLQSSSSCRVHDSHVCRASATSRHFSGLITPVAMSIFRHWERSAHTTNTVHAVDHLDMMSLKWPVLCRVTDLQASNSPPNSAVVGSNSRMIKPICFQYFPCSVKFSAVCIMTIQVIWIYMKFA